MAAVTAVLAGCATEPNDFPALRAEREAKLLEISRSCGLPASTIKMVGIDELRIRPPSDAKYENVDCMLTALREAGIPMRMGFVGNEAFQTERK